MPCNCDHLEASGLEIALSRVACLLDELGGKQFDSKHWRGYHPRVYNRQVDGNSLTSELCSKLQDVDVTNYSLEMQIWWRDHQKADKERIEQELLLKKEGEERKAALSKLTEYEKNLLGIKGVDNA